MHLINSIWIFYRKLIFPSMVISILIGALGMLAAGPFLLASTGVAFMFVAPLFQYFIYKISHPDEYYF